MPYGNIMAIDTTGASADTASQDGHGPGVGASEEMARTDFERMNKYRSIIKKAADHYDVDPALIAAIISRESRAGNQLNNGWGDHGNAWGLMQVDKRYHTPVGAWDSLEHLKQATKILVDFISVMRKRFSGWNAHQHLKGAISAYNKDYEKIRSYESVDAQTTGRDYSNDVVARAKWYKTHMSF